MKLKKMEIIGFKSFLDKASIEFPPGVCAVVGPNGCGKSNIFDALCWVMGEQSIKQLRGKSMGDVIFAGAGGKPALNMAEVSLTLVNDGTLMPEELRDFSEIMITRRLYRSGESAYLINKRPCRLKDVQNIFLGSGLGAKSYAIIQQGRIGAITDAGPGERRFFIEEAAGVTRYKQRKDEALRKVDSTQQNLLRLNDIIAEVERQMEALKRQAAKAEVFNRCQRQMTELDVRLSLRQCGELSREIGEADLQLSALRDTERGQQAELHQLDSSLERIKLSRFQKNQFISEQRSDKFDIQRRIDRTENDLAHLREEDARLSRELDALGAAREELLTKNDRMSREIEQILTENADTRAALEGVQGTLDRENEASRVLRESRAALEQSLEKDRRRLLEMSAKEAQQQNIYQHATQNRETLQRRLRQTDEQEALARRRLREAESELQGAREDLEGCRGEVEDLKGRISLAEVEIQDGRRALGETLARSQALQVERKSTVASYAALKKMEDSLEWYKDGVRAILKSRASAGGGEPAARPAFMNGILGVMADVVEPAPSYEMAVEAVFGESLQYILVHDDEVGRGAIDYLQRSGSGRGGFIPVSSVKTLALEGTKGPEAEKRLLNHVKVSAGYEKVAEALLGHVAVAEDLSDAMALYRRNGAVQTVVTKGGDVVSHQGIMIGGSRENLAGILLKKKELKALQQQISELDRAVDQARIEQEAAEGRVTAAETELAQLAEEKNQALRDEMESEKALYRATEDHKGARHHLDIVQLEQEQLQGEQSDVQDELERFKEELAQLREEIQGLQQRIESQGGALSDLNDRAAAFDQRILDCRMEQTTLTARLENGESTLRRLQDFQRDGKERLEQLRRDIDTKTERRGAAAGKISELETALPVQYESIQGIDQVLERHEGEYQALSEEMRKKDAMVAEVQRRREKTAQKTRILEDAQSERRMRLEGKTARLEERYRRSFQELVSGFADASEQRSSEQMEAQLADLRRRLEGMGEVNPGAIREYESQKERFEFLAAQRDDLNQALEDLKKVIRRINRVTQTRFLETLTLVNEKLGEVFPRLFEGGTAELVLTEPDTPLESGLEFIIHPPGKKVTRLSLLSGGEKALCAISFIFSIFLLKPASYCLMDEIDAPLDESNVFRFNELLRIIGEKSQIVMITHNKRSMEFADVLFGVTMEKKGISKIVSVNLERRQAA